MNALDMAHLAEDAWKRSQPQFFFDFNDPAVGAFVRFTPDVTACVAQARHGRTSLAGEPTARHSPQGASAIPADTDGVRRGSSPASRTSTASTGSPAQASAGRGIGGDSTWTDTDF